MACAACVRLLGREATEAHQDPKFPINFAGVASKGVVTKQFSLPHVCSFCGGVYCLPRVQLDVKVYQRQDSRAPYPGHAATPPATSPRERS